MFFYAIVFSATFLLLAVYCVRGSSWAYWFAVSVLFLLSAMRFDVGVDFLQFYTIEVPPWNEISLLASGRDFNRFGLSVKALYVISDWLDCRQLIFIVTSAIIYYSFGFVILRYSPNVLVSWACFIGFFSLQSFNMIWQMTAVAIVLLTIGPILGRKPLRFALLILLAMSFHTSAIVASAAYPVYHWIRTRWVVVTGCVLMGFVPVILSLVVAMGMYSSYLDELDQYPGGEKLKFIYPLLLASLAVLRHLRNGQEKMDPDGVKPEGCRYVEDCKLAAVASMGMFPPFYFGASLGNRISFYFLCFFILWCPRAMGNCVIQKLLYSLCFCLFFFATIFLTQRSDMIEDTNVPYRCFLFSDTDDFRERWK